MVSASSLLIGEKGQFFVPVRAGTKLFPDRSQTKPVTLAREQFDQTVRTSSAPKQTQLPRRLSHTPCRPVQSKRLSSSLPEEGAREMGWAKVI